jgi:hypothetical protein
MHHDVMLASPSAASMASDAAGPETVMASKQAAMLKVVGAF